MTIKTILACVDCGSRNYTYPVKSSQTKRLELKKYCKTCGTQTIHRETK